MPSDAKLGMKMDLTGIKKGSKDAKKIINQNLNGKTATGFTSKLKTGFKAALVPMAAIGGSIAGALYTSKKLFDLWYSMSELARDYNDSLLMVTRSMDIQGYKFVEGQHKQFIDDISTTLSISREDINKSLSAFIDRGNTFDQAKELSVLAAQASLETGKSMDGVTKLISKAMAGEVNALKQLNITIPKTGDKLKDAENAAEALRAKFADVGFGLVNNSQLLQANIDIIKTELSQQVLPLFEDLLSWVNGVITAWREGAFDEHLQTFRTNFEGLMNGVLKPSFFFIVDSMDIMTRQWNVMYNLVMAGWESIMAIVKADWSQLLPILFDSYTVTMGKMTSFTIKLIKEIMSLFPTGGLIAKLMGFDSIAENIDELTNKTSESMKEKFKKMNEESDGAFTKPLERIESIKDILNEPLASQKLKDMASEGMAAIDEARSRVKGQVGSNDSLVSKNLIEEERLKAEKKNGKGNSSGEPKGDKAGSPGSVSKVYADLPKSGQFTFQIKSPNSQQIRKVRSYYG